MFSRRYLIAALACSLAACADSPSGASNPTTVVNQDLADLAADGVAEDIGIMSGLDGTLLSWDGTIPTAARAGLVAPRPPRLTGCSFADGTFTCARVRDNGLDVDRSVTFLDAQGTPQAAYDAQTTASVHLLVAVGGTVTRGPWSATIARTRDFTISGLAGTETTRTVHGTGSETVSRAGHGRNGVERGYALSAASTATAVVFPVRSGESDPWPLSGTITRTVTVTPLAGAPFTRTVVITFNGTSAPTGTVDGEPFTFDLMQRKAAQR